MRSVKGWAIVEGASGCIATFWDSGRGFCFPAIMETRNEASALKPKCTAKSRIVRVEIRELKQRKRRTK